MSIYNAALITSDISYKGEITYTHGYIESVVSVVTVPLDTENALCNNGVQYEKYQYII